MGTFGRHRVIRRRNRGRGNKGRHSSTSLSAAAGGPELLSQVAHASLCGGHPERAKQKLLTGIRGKSYEGPLSGLEKKGTGLQAIPGAREGKKTRAQNPGGGQCVGRRAQLKKAGSKRKRDMIGIHKET